MPKYIHGSDSSNKTPNLRPSQPNEPLLIDTASLATQKKPTVDVRIRMPRSSSLPNQLATVEVEDEDLHAPFPALGTASIPSSIVNIANTILGSGILAMPHAVSSIGLIPGFFMIAFSAFASGMGLFLLGRCAAHTTGRSASFNSCARLTFPNAALWFDLAIAVKCFGVGISYLIIIGDLMPEIVKSVGISGAYWDPYLPWLLSRRFWITVFMAVIVPLAYLPTLNALRYTSTVALMSVAYLWCIVVFHYIGDETVLPPEDEAQYVKLSWSFFNNLPIFVFAFTCHQNIFAVYNELKENTPRNMNIVIAGAIGAALFVYETVGILGYLSFGDTVGVNILGMFNKGPAVTIGRLSFVFLVLFSFPLQCHPCRFSLDKVLFSISSKLPKRYAPLVNTDEDDDAESEASERVGEATGEGSEPRRPRNRKNGTAVPTPSPLRHAALTTGIVVCSYTAAMLVSSLDVVLSFVGATGSTTISFILPGLFYWKLYERESVRDRPSKLAGIILAGYGLCVMVVCLGFNFGKASAH